jgi:hypothetical protein
MILGIFKSKIIKSKMYRGGEMKTSRAKFVFLMLISLSVVMLASSVQAGLPVGQWNMTFYYDDQGFTQGGTEGLCFEGGPSKGTWYSTTFAGWSGDWWRKGGNSDIVMLKGNYDSGLGNDGAVLELISVSLMTGSMVQWRDDTSYVDWIKVRLNKQSSICDPQPLVNMATTANPSGK